MYVVPPVIRSYFPPFFEFHFSRIHKNSKKHQQHTSVDHGDDYDREKSFYSVAA